METKKEFVIATHNGEFHADEVFACALAKRYIEAAGFNVRIVRTRDSEEIEKADMAIDVGGVYDPKKLRFDHHQEGDSAKKASAGKVKQFLAQLVGREFLDGLWREVGRIDKTDLTAKPNPISSAISAFNPTYEESSADMDQRFALALNVVEESLRKIEAYPVHVPDAPIKEGETVFDFIEKQNRLYSHIGRTVSDDEADEAYARQTPDGEFKVRFYQRGDTDPQRHHSGAHDIVWNPDRGKFFNNPPPSLQEALEGNSVVQERLTAHQESLNKGMSLFIEAVQKSQNPEVLNLPIHEGRGF